MSRRLNPRMEEALQLMLRGHLQHRGTTGWFPTVGSTKEPFNSHTVFYLQSQGYVRILHGSQAHIRAAGRAALAIQEYAA